MSLLIWEWDEFVRELDVKLREWQVRWPFADVALDPFVDRSWVDTLFHLRGCAGLRLEELSQEQREQLVGRQLGENTCFFGELHAAGSVVSTLRDPTQPGVASKIAVIEAARSRARALPRRPAVSDVMEPWTAIASIDRFGPASASRLLMTERPDLYLMLNSKSCDGLARELGVRVPTLQMPGVAGCYAAILEVVYSTRWWQGSTVPPRELLQRFLWDGRAALVDVFVYDADAA